MVNVVKLKFIWSFDLHTEVEWCNLSFSPWCNPWFKWRRNGGTHGVNGGQMVEPMVNSINHLTSVHHGLHHSTFISMRSNS